MGKPDPERDALHAAISANSAHVQEDSGGAVLTGWVVLSEWMDKDGAKYLAWCRAPGTAAWAARGMMHDILYRPDDDGG